MMTSNGACLDDDFFTVVCVKCRPEKLGRKVGRKGVGVIPVCVS